jgi:hypothetical protein
MKKLPGLLLSIVLVCFAGCQSVDTSAVRIPIEQQAKIEGLSFTEILLSPVVKLNWGDLRSFEITDVTGTNVGAFSKSEAVVGPGQCSVTIRATAELHYPATHTLTFEAKAGRRYVVRPVYRGRDIEVAIQDSGSLEIVARSWVQ